jgi:uncharacterized membrane protein YfcA
MVGIPTLTILLSTLFIVSILFSMLGQGGGALYTPLQVYVGINFHTAATTSLFLIMITSLSSTIVYRKASKIDWPLAVVLETVTVSGGLLGGLFSERLSGEILSIIFAITVGIAALFMIFRPEPTLQPESVPKWRGLTRWRRNFAGHLYSVNLLVALPVSFVVGAASGLVGVGGGILNVPLMVLLLGIPMDIAIGSSAFMVGLTSAGGFTGHVISGHWDWKLSLILSIAVFIGGQIGARISIRANKQKLKVAFGWFLLAIAVSMLLKAAL